MWMCVGLRAPICVFKRSKKDSVYLSIRVPACACECGSECPWFSEWAPAGTLSLLVDNWTPESSSHSRRTHTNTWQGVPPETTHTAWPCRSHVCHSWVGRSWWTSLLVPAESWLSCPELHAAQCGRDPVPPVSCGWCWPWPWCSPEPPHFWCQRGCWVPGSRLGSCGLAPPLLPLVPGPQCRWPVLWWGSGGVWDPQVLGCILTPEHSGLCIPHRRPPSPGHMPSSSHSLAPLEPACSLGRWPGIHPVSPGYRGHSE